MGPRRRGAHWQEHLWGLPRCFILIAAPLRLAPRALRRAKLRLLPCLAASLPSCDALASRLLLNGVTKKCPGGATQRLRPRAL